MIVLGTIIALTPKYIAPSIKQLIDYNRAQKYFSSEKYDDAIDAFDKLGKYKDAPEKKMESTYQKALHLMNEGNYDDAISLFCSIKSYEDAETKSLEASYCKAEKLLSEEQYDLAKSLFYSIQSYSDSLERINEVDYKQGDHYLKNGEYLMAKAKFESLGTFQDSAERALEAGYAGAEAFYKNEQYWEAFLEWNELGDYLDCKELIENAKTDLLEKGEYTVLEEALSSIGDVEGMKECIYIQGTSEIDSDSNFFMDTFYGLQKLNSIRDYKDTNEVIVKKEFSLLSNANVGSYVIFGAYEQDGDNENGSEVIQWKVMEKKNDSVLLQATVALMARPLGYKKVTWETSSLRAFLNNDFFETAFSTEEKSQIMTTVVKVEKNPYKNKKISFSEGNDTKDKIFIWDAPYCAKYQPSFTYSKVVMTTVEHYYITYPATWTRTTYNQSRFLDYSPSNSLNEYWKLGGFLGGTESIESSLPVVPLMWVKIPKN